MSDTVKSWIEERRAIQSAARPFTEADPDDFERSSIFAESADRERVEANITASNDGLLHFPRALDAIEQASKLADRLRESAYIFEVLGDSPTVVEERRATARMIDRVIESALEAGE